ncbi:MAG TPA: protein kinase, partial [Candidatus Nanopelagicales bacterium]|nr:protein kinase [Candidatus Nanopelagicales bacterium]
RQNPGIIQALHVGAAISPTGRWAPFLVMEWAEGPPLDRRLTEQRRAGEGPMGIVAAARLLASAAEAIAAMHEENVAHLDIKPANLMFARAGAGTILKVLDFGVARTFAEDPRLTASTTSSTARPTAFTPQYGAPEQFSKQYGAPGPWTDVFAMALVLIEVASGRRVLEGENVMQLFVSAIQEDRRTDVIQRVAGRSAELRAVLGRALEVNPRLRFRTMDTFWSALERAMTSGDEVTMPTATLPSVAPEEGAATETRGAPPPEPDPVTEEPVSTTMSRRQPEVLPQELGQSRWESIPAPRRAARGKALGAALALATMLSGEPGDAPTGRAVLRAALRDHEFSAPEPREPSGDTPEVNRLIDAMPSVPSPAGSPTVEPGGARAAPEELAARTDRLGPRAAAGGKEPQRTAPALQREPGAPADPGSQPAGKSSLLIYAGPE